MRVLVAGATGVIGRQLVPLLGAADHQVIALARSRDRAAGLGVAEVLEADLLDRSAVAKAVAQSAPDAVVHLATAIPAAINPKKMARDFALTDRLRTEGTRNLLDAAVIRTTMADRDQLVAFDIRGGRVHAIFAVLNPDKLGKWVSDTTVRYE